MQSARRDESGWPADGVWRGPKPGSESRWCLRTWRGSDGIRWVCLKDAGHDGKCHMLGKRETVW